jgi:tetratricopeptide (TPR) repeat protein
MTVQRTASKKLPFILSLASVVAVSLWGSPSFAGDPFRTTNPRNIGDQTEAAFQAMFHEGNYKQAKEYLIQAEQSDGQDPLVYALRAGLAFTEGDKESLKNYAAKTLSTAGQLKAQDPLRGNLYLAVGNFLDGAYILQTQGAVSAVSKLQLVFQSLDAAEKIDSNDPELNLIKGYLDLILAVHLPFSSPDQAIQRFETNAAPDYLVYRGIASAYRDLKKYDQALQFIDKALDKTPDNPEVLYLKGQVLRLEGKQKQDISLLKEAGDYLAKAETKKEQLPLDVQKAIDYDKGRVSIEINELQSKK